MTTVSTATETNASVSTVTVGVATAQIHFAKQWSDADNQDFLRPSSVKYTVTDNSDSAKKITVTLTRENGWKTSIAVPNSVAADFAQHFMTTEATIAGYTASEASGSGTSDSPITIANSHTPATTSLTATVKWEDTNDLYASRPESVTLQLQRRVKGSSGDWTDKGTMTVTKDTAWQCTWNDLPVCVIDVDPTNQSFYEYRVVETTNVPNYTEAAESAAVSTTVKKEDGTASANLTASVENTLETTSLTVEKVWDDESDFWKLRPDSVTVKLQRKIGDEAWYDITSTVVGFGDVTAGKTPITKTVSGTGDAWTVTWTNLPAKDNNGNVYKYRAAESNVSKAYQTEIPAFEDMTCILTNTLKMREVTLSEVWEDDFNRDGLRPTETTLNVTLNGVQAAGSEPQKQHTLKKDGDWKANIQIPDVTGMNNENLYFTVSDATSHIGYEPKENVVSVSDADTVVKFTNVHTPATTSVTFVKTWVDDNNRFGSRSDSITLQLYQHVVGSGDAWVTYGNAVTTKAENGWSYTWTALPVCLDDDTLETSTVSYEYRVEEAALQNYKAADPSASVSTTVNANTGAASNAVLETDITNTLNTTSLTVSKNWVDFENAWKLRPATVTVKLQWSTDGSTWANVNVPNLQLTENANWNGSFVGLPMYDAAGNMLRYQAVEVDLSDDYTSVSEGGNITNTLITEEITLTKVWADDGDRDALRPSSVELVLTMENGAAQTYTLPKESDATWEYTVSVPKEHTYTVTEPNVPNGYTASVSDYTVTNTHAIKTVNVDASKVWVSDDGFSESFRREVTLKLQYSTDGTNFTDYLDDPTRTVTNTTPTARWTNLPANCNGVAYYYSVVEVASHNYTPTYSPAVSTASVEHGGTLSLTVTNTFQTIDLTVTKKWVDEDNAWGLRPKTVTVKAQWSTDGQTWTDVPSVSPVVFTETDQWASKTVVGLPRYDADGRAVSYRVVETDPSADYIADYANAILTDTLINKTVTLEKVWDDGENCDGLRPTTVTLQLTMDDKVSKDGITLDADGNWTKDISVPANHTYAVEETVVPLHYTAAVTQNGNVFTVTNTHVPARTAVQFTKVWENDANDGFGSRPNSITLQLYQRIKGSETWNGYGDAVKTNAADRWCYTWSDLPVCLIGDDPTAEPVLYEYKVEEVDTLPNYTVTVASSPVSTTVNADTGAASNAVLETGITNTLNTTSLTVTKTWDDLENTWNLRPDTVTVKLQWRVGDGEWEDVTNVGTLSLTADDGWASKTFSGLPIVNAMGEELSYRAAEIDLSDDYTSVSEGGNITNTLITEEITLTKVWADDGDRDALRPSSVVLVLKMDEDAATEEIKEYTVSASEDWKHTVSVPASHTYTVIEKTVPSGYSAKVDDTTVTNAHSIYTVSVEATKHWTDDGDFADSFRDDVVLTLEWSTDGANFAPYPSNPNKTVTQDSKTVVWSDLPANSAGSACYYRVVETSATGNYHPSYSDAVIAGSEKDGQTLKLTVTNTFRQTTLEVNKTWIDFDNEWNLRPTAVTVKLQWSTDCADWSDVPNMGNLTLTESDNWGGKVFTGLPVVDASGEPLYYRAVEIDLSDDYTSVSEGGNITNTLITKEITLTKVWADDGDRDSLRPAQTTLTLTMDGTTDKHYTLDENGDWMCTVAVPAAHTFTVAETVVPEGYTATVEGFTVINQREHGTVTFVVTKIWNDNTNRFHTRPLTTEIELDLERSTDGVTWSSVSDVMPQIIDNGDDTWTVIYHDLPDKDGLTPIQYRVTEVPFGQYTPTYGVPMENNGILTQQIENTLLVSELMIDNTTINPADNGSTNVGGYVVVGNGVPQRDQTPYEQYRCSVAWWAEENWQFSGTFRVRYLEHGATTWSVITVTDSADLSALRARFADATLDNSGDQTVLVLAQNVSDMPKQTCVEVSFLPTLATENTTKDDNGGQVQVVGGTWGQSSDGVNNGRYHQTVVLAQADFGWCVDLTNLQLGAPGTDGNDVGDAHGAIILNPDKNGFFSVYYNTGLAGEYATVLVEGRVEVMSRDINDQPIAVRIILNELPVSIDIGIPFTEVTRNAVPNESDEPHESDEPNVSDEPYESEDPGTGIPATADVRHIPMMLIPTLGISAALWYARRKKRVWLHRKQG